MNHDIQIPTTHINISPTLFHEYACQYFACEKAFAQGTKYSPVPYFLVCRAIELQLKAKHLESKSSAEVKKQFGHNLKKSYDALSPSEQTLTTAEYKVLVETSDIYDIPNKGFEYVSVGEAVSGLRGFPDLAVLEHIAAKLIAE